VLRPPCSIIPAGCVARQQIAPYGEGLTSGTHSGGSFTSRRPRAAMCCTPTTARSAHSLRFI